MQMMLPGPVVSRDQTYIRKYRDHCENPNQYVILDNGAAERKQIGHDALFDMAINFKPDELVLPDIMKDGPATLTATENFMQRQNVEYLKDLGMKLAFVVQGNGSQDAFDTLQSMVGAWWSQFVSVIHLPRLLVTPGLPDDRLRLAILAQNLYQERGENIECHFLGANTVWPQEIKYASHFEYVRSMDTSAPYYMAYWQRPIDSTIWKGALERPEDYFDRSAETFRGSNQYVNTFLAWAVGKEPDAQTPPGRV